MEEVEWKKIDEDGFYEISILGVRSWRRNGGDDRTPNQRSNHPRVLKFDVNREGYLRVEIRCCETRIRKCFHKLLAEHFIPNPDNLKEVDHIDGDRQNNALNNLRWCSSIQNNYNTKLPNNNTSGHKGVSKRKFFINGKSYEYWVAIWRENDKVKSKYFKTIDEAIEYRRQMVELYYDPKFYIEDRK